MDTKLVEEARKALRDHPDTELIFDGNLDRDRMANIMADFLLRRELENTRDRLTLLWALGVELVEGVWHNRRAEIAEAQLAKPRKTTEANSQRQMLANEKRPGTRHVNAHAWSISCYAPPRCKKESPRAAYAERFLEANLCDVCGKPISESHVAFLEQFANRCDGCVFRGRKPEEVSRD